MTNTTKYLPWFLSAVLATLLSLLWYDSKQSLAKKDVDLAVLKQQYDQLATDANRKIAEANSSLRQLADEANKKIQIANQPEIPVRVTFRKALFSSGNVASFANISGQIIAITGNIERPSSGQSHSFELTIDRGQTKEIGEREGWAFVPGDTITLSQPDHKSLAIRAP